MPQQLFKIYQQFLTIEKTVVVCDPLSYSMEPRLIKHIWKTILEISVHNVSQIQKHLTVYLETTYNYTESKWLKFEVEEWKTEDLNGKGTIKMNLGPISQVRD